MAAAHGKIVMPGDGLPEIDEYCSKRKIIVGPGLHRVDDHIVAYKAGTVHFKKPSVFWVDNYQCRYIPGRAECVIGQVIAKAGDIFRVDIGSYEPASLSYLSFESATKKNRPDVNVGDLLYARLLNANRDAEAELVCVDSFGKKGKLGVLHGGFMFNCSLNLARMILRENCPLFRSLTKEMPFEIAVGHNGRIWVRAKTVRETIALGHAILTAENATYEEMQRICENIGNILFT